MSLSGLQMSMGALIYSGGYISVLTPYPGPNHNPCSKPLILPQPYPYSAVRMSMAELQDGTQHGLQQPNPKPRNEVGFKKQSESSPAVMTRGCKKFAVLKHAWAMVPYSAIVNFTNMSLAWLQESSDGLRRRRPRAGNAVGFRIFPSPLLQSGLGNASSLQSKCLHTQGYSRVRL